MTEDLSNSSHGATHAALSAGDIVSAFASMGLRATEPRRHIADLIAEMAVSRTDFATEDLWRRLKEKHPGIGRATVFRSVDLLVKQGILDRVPLGDGRHHYRACGRHHHHHVSCTTCRRVVEIDECLSPEILQAIASATDFAIDGHSLELFGRCPLCKGTGGPS